MFRGGRTERRRRQVYGKDLTSWPLGKKKEGGDRVGFGVEGPRENCMEGP